VILKQFQGHALMFSDGACSGNPGPGGWAAICVSPEGQIVEMGGSDPATTNNRMEILGSIEGIRRLSKIKAPIQAFTDSTYVIRGITGWVFGWRRSGWKTAEGKDVLNRDLWEELSRVIQAHGHPVKWNYLRGHSGIPANDRVDALAVALSRGEKPQFFRGVMSEYPVDLADLPDSFELPDMKSPGSSKKAGFYLSWVNGELKRHTTWPECEAHVKGRSGAKFKKVTSEAEAREIAQGWGAKYTNLVE
jgi:ribonuclease HI